MARLSDFSLQAKLNLLPSARLVLSLLRLSVNGCATDALGLTQANGFYPSGLPTLSIARGTRRANESVKKQKDINDKRFSFVLAFESLAGRAKRLSLDLLFRFASRQNEKQTR